jgi:hypothetical protein
MSSRYADHNMARTIRVHQRMDDDLLLPFLPVLSCGDGYDRIIRARKAGCCVQ